MSQCVGIILCAAKNSLEMEFALKSKSNPIGVTEYQLPGKRPTARQLQEVLPASYRRMVSPDHPTRERKRRPTVRERRIEAPQRGINPPALPSPAALALARFDKDARLTGRDLYVEHACERLAARDGPARRHLMSLVQLAKLLGHEPWAI